MPGDKISSECIEILSLLKERRNVLVSGPPAAGKSRLLNEVADAFASARLGAKPAPKPMLDFAASVPIPATLPVPELDAELQAVLPAADCRDRRVFRTVFHQATKHRDVVTGIAPDLSTGVGGAFTVVQGVLYQASEHAMLPDGAALVIIDEINRGPAVQAFGGAIVAIEGEKRLAPDNTHRRETQYFDLLDPKSKTSIQYAFPHHLYILGAMNQADVSVEPLDVAFLRRWAPFTLRPDATKLRAHFTLGVTAEGALPPQPGSAADIYEAAVRAWEKVNERIELGRGTEFQIGHGVMMVPSGKAPQEVADALVHVASAWKTVRAHVDEVFFGDVRGVAAVINALDGPASHPYQLVETVFAGEPRQRLKGPAVVGSDGIYQLLLAVAGMDNDRTAQA